MDAYLIWLCNLQDHKTRYMKWNQWKECMVSKGEQEKVWK